MSSEIQQKLNEVIVNYMDIAYNPVIKNTIYELLENLSELIPLDELEDKIMNIITSDNEDNDQVILQVNETILSFTEELLLDYNFIITRTTTPFKSYNQVLTTINDVKLYSDVNTPAAINILVNDIDNNNIKFSKLMSLYTNSNWCSNYEYVDRVPSNFMAGLLNILENISGIDVENIPVNITHPYIIASNVYYELLDQNNNITNVSYHDHIENIYTTTLDAEIMDLDKFVSETAVLLYLDNEAENAIYEIDDHIRSDLNEMGIDPSIIEISIKRIKKRYMQIRTEDEKN
jgi:hypothetical protein